MDTPPSGPEQAPASGSFLLKPVRRLSQRRIFRFIVAGSSGAATDLLILFILVDVVHLWYLASAVIAFIVSWFVSFGMQKFWTFQDKDHSAEVLKSQAALFLAVALGNLGLNTALMYVFVDILNLWYLLAQVAAALLIAVESFFVYKLFVFPGAPRR